MVFFDELFGVFFFLSTRENLQVVISIKRWKLEAVFTIVKECLLTNLTLKLLKYSNELNKKRRDVDNQKSWQQTNSIKREETLTLGNYGNELKESFFEA